MRRVPPAILNRSSAPAAFSFRTSARIWPAACKRSYASLTSTAVHATPRLRQNSTTLDRASRLFALRFWSAMLLALILAGVFGFHIPRFLGFTALSYTVAGIDLGLILAGFFLFLALLAFSAAELKRKTIRYIITDNKIIREDGILNKNTQMIPYTQLERVDLHQSFAQRIMKIGTIVVDTGDDKLSIDMVRHPAKVQELLSNRLGRRAWDGQTPPGQQPQVKR